MGIPIWKPTKQMQRPMPSTVEQQDSTTHHPYYHQHSPQHRLHRARRTGLLLEHYYTASDTGYTTNTRAHAPQTTEPQQRTYTRHRHQTPPSLRRLQNSTTARRLEMERQVELRLFEKQELLEQLQITASLLDQFISIRDISGRDMALPPFITDDLLAILTATSATLISPSIPTRPNININDNTTLDTTRRQSFAARLQDLELNIASVHHKVCHQLDRLGASLIAPPQPPPPFLSLPVNPSLSG